MPGPHLHIVCLDVPYPPDYGGVFDLFYKIRTLHELGVRIHLHCFEYGRGRPDALRAYCETVHYYNRSSFLTSLFRRAPYIVGSRASPALLDNLLADGHPVLLEGVHCTWFLHTGSLSGRRVAIRLHNVEYIYYRELARATRNPVKKIFFLRESALLEKYERRLLQHSLVIAVSEQDQQICRQQFGATDVRYLPVFLPFGEVTAPGGTGTYCLYHGNLAVAENEQAARWLITEVFIDLDIPLVVAGKNPSRALRSLVARHPGVSLVAGPDDAEMEHLIAGAQIHVLPSWNATGIKIKLLHALFCGRHVVTNATAVRGTSLAGCCHVAGDARSFAALVHVLQQQPFDLTLQEQRRELLREFDHERNARQLMQWLS